MQDRLAREFLETAKSVFGFLLPLGFAVEEEEVTPLTAVVTYRGDTVGVRVSFDARDACIACRVQTSATGTAWVSLEDFLVRNCGFRRILRGEDRSRDHSTWTRMALTKYADGLRLPECTLLPAKGQP